MDKISQNTIKHHYHFTTILQTTAENAFEYLDDPKKLSSHMGKSSWMMAGSKMNIKLDEKEGRGIGAEIILDGTMMGIPLFVREFVTESERPKIKVWETKGPQKLIIMGQYRMGFELTPEGTTTQLKVFIDYSLPSVGVQKVLGLFFSKLYARWCTEQMAKDAVNHFSKKNT